MNGCEGASNAGRFKLLNNNGLLWRENLRFEYGKPTFFLRPIVASHPANYRPPWMILHVSMSIRPQLEIRSSHDKFIDPTERIPPSLPASFLGKHHANHTIFT